MLRNAFSVRIALAAVVLLGTCATAHADDAVAKSSKPRTRNVAIVVHEGVELLDFAGPGEVFAAAARRGAVDGVPWFNVYTVAPSPGPVKSQGFVKIEPQFTIDTCPKPDILVIPGGETNVLLNDAKFMAWVRDNASQREISSSVCTGAFVLAKAGLLDGLDATTHWGSINGLKGAAPKAKVHADRRFIDNGRVITTAGVSAGIDGALHIVARLLGKSIADQPAHYMEYDWKPDASMAATYSELNPQLDERGRAIQQADQFRRDQKWPEAIKAYEALVKQEPNNADHWYYYGYCFHAAGDLDKAIEIHKKAASLNDRRQRPLYNLACAYALKGDKEQALKTLQEAIDAGFASKDYALNDEDFKSLRDDPRFKALLDKIK